jgi:tetratricopeptide (TPR) repeat protein
MSKISRNAPCPCGSGRKHKRCCLAADRTQAEPQADVPPSSNSRTILAVPGWDQMENDLDRISNRVVDLIHEGRLDEAEEAGKKLLQDYPEVHDGFERLAMLYEARGDKTHAVEMYQRALDFTMDHGELYDQEMPTYFRNKIARLSSVKLD